MQHQQPPKTLLELFKQLKDADQNLDGVINASAIEKLKALNPKLAEEAEKYRYTYLHAAVATSNKAAANYLLTEANVDPNLKDNQQKTALLIIMQHMRNEKEIWKPYKDAPTKTLQDRELAKLARARKQKSWQYSLATVEKELATLLLENGAQLGLEDKAFFLVNATALNIDLFACEKKAAKKSLSALNKAVIANDLSAVTAQLASNPAAINLADSAGYTPLHYAVEENKADNCIYVLSDNTNPVYPSNIFPRAILLQKKGSKIVAYKKVAEVLETIELDLTAEEIKIIENTIVAYSLSQTWLAFNKATQANLAEKILKQAGYDYSEMIKLLLQKEPDLKAVTNAGDTLLHIAAKNECLSSMTALLKTNKISATFVNKKNIPGYDFYSLDTMPNDIKDGAYDKSYIFIKETAKLYYASGQSSKEIRIRYIDKFKHDFTALLGASNYKRLNDTQFKDLITDNGDYEHTQGITAIDLIHEATKKGPQDLEICKNMIDLLTRYGALYSGSQPKDFLALQVNGPMAKSVFGINVEAKVLSEEERTNKVINDQRAQQALTHEVIDSVNRDFKDQKLLMGRVVEQLALMGEVLEQQKLERLALPAPTEAPSRKLVVSNNPSSMFPHEREETISIPRREWKEMKREREEMKRERQEMKHEREEMKRERQEMKREIALLQESVRRLENNAEAHVPDEASRPSMGKG